MSTETKDPADQLLTQIMGEKGAEEAKKAREAAEPAEPELVDGRLLVPLANVVASPETAQIRTADGQEDEFKALVKSIKNLGIINPLVVAEHEGQYILIAGYRRWAAATQLGLDTVPVTLCDTKAFAGPIGKILSRKRPGPDLVRQFVGIVDNTARASLSEVDICKAIRWLLASDKGGRYIRKGTANVSFTKLAEDLGTPEQWTRNRLAVVSHYKLAEIEEIDRYVKDGKWTWTGVHASLRSGTNGKTEVDALVFGKSKPQPPEGGEPEPEEPAKKKPAGTNPEPLDFRKRVRFDGFDSEGVGLDLVGTRGSDRVMARLTVEVPLNKAKYGFSGARGDAAFTKVFQDAAEALTKVGDHGSGKNASKEEQEWRSAARNTANDTLEAVRAKAAES